MRLELLKEILFELYGKPSVNVIEILYGKIKVNEFDISKKLELTINQTRNILYKLSDSGLVSFTRKKDKKKGWYTYFWTLEEGKSLEFLKKMLENKIKRLETEIAKRSQERFYLCKICNIEVNEETALERNFICPDCGSVYELSDDNKLVKVMIREKMKFIPQLKNIENELETMKEKGKKKIVRAEKKLAKEKSDKRKKSAKLRAIERKKQAKITPPKKKTETKKIIKKKSKK